MIFSDTGTKFCSKSGILQLMDDIGRPLPEGVKPHRLGGGNPALIPEISAMYRQEMQKLYNSNGFIPIHIFPLCRQWKMYRMENIILPLKAHRITLIR